MQEIVAKSKASGAWLCTLFFVEAGEALGRKPGNGSNISVSGFCER